MRLILCAVAMAFIACNEQPQQPQPNRFIVEQRNDGDFKVIIDKVTGCQFLYVNVYHESGLSAIPGTCKKAVTP